VSLFLGLGLRPESYDPFVDHLDAQALLQHFVRLRHAINQTVGGMPGHADYIARHAKAPQA
jgi:tryptophan halogenase